MASLQGNLRAVPKISQLREKAGITQLELSLMVGVTETSIQNWERGRAGVEQIERVIRLCQALNCKPEDLIEYVEMSEAEATQAKPKGSERLKRMRELLDTHKLDPTSPNGNNIGSQVGV